MSDDSMPIEVVALLAAWKEIQSLRAQLAEAQRELDEALTDRYDRVQDLETAITKLREFVAAFDAWREYSAIMSLASHHWTELLEKRAALEDL